MLSDVSWLSAQAHQIHGIFYGLFYALVTTLLILGIFIEYFKWPLGNMPSFSVLIGRALIATILLHTYSEVSNTIADVVDALAQRLGDLNRLSLVLSKMGDKLGDLTVSWLSFKETVVYIISFLSFFLLYLAVHAVNAFLLFTWTLLYVFSPLLIALYVLPATAGATKGLYRSLIEVSCWKIVWSVLSTLLWSLALSDINKAGHNIPFVTVIFLNLILAGSLLLTPSVVHALAGGGFTGLAQTAGGIVAGATMAMPFTATAAAAVKAKKAYSTASRVSRGVGQGVNFAKENLSSGSRSLLKKQVPVKRPGHDAEKKKTPPTPPSGGQS